MFKIPVIFRRSYPMFEKQSDIYINKDAYPPSRWLSIEFFFYYIVLIFAAFKAISSGLKVSTPEGNPNFSKVSLYLSNGWLGKYMDNSDIQFAAFRNNFFLLLLMMVLFSIASRLFRYIKRERFILIVSCVFLFALHGTNSILIVILMSVNYFFCKIGIDPRFSTLFPLLTWVWGLVTLIASEWIGPIFSLPILDRLEYAGGYPRWWVIYNLSVLRMISFNMDYYFALKEKTELVNDKESSMKHVINCVECKTQLFPCERSRTSTARPLDEYNYENYLTYLLYIPLFISGPIITFNNFQYQKKSPLSLPFQYKIIYFLRLVFAILLMELMMHSFYVVAIKNAKAWAGLSALDLFCIGYWNLKLIWLKLLVIWRFARFWALVDGIEAPENMLRCMSNNYSGLAFWRSWHRSFNQWLIRYVYIPLGGSKKAKFNIWVIFTFVAIWHDRTFKLLAWGWLICLFIVPELLLRYFSKKLKAPAWSSFRIISGIAGSLNVYLMSIANLVGFAVGLDGIYMILESVFSLEGATFLVGSFISVYAAVQIMFEIREQEYRNTGIMKNY